MTNIGTPINCPQGKLTKSDPARAIPPIKRNAMRKLNEAAFILCMIFTLWNADPVENDFTILFPGRLIQINNRSYIPMVDGY